jgi:hypothetical protein
MTAAGPLFSFLMTEDTDMATTSQTDSGKSSTNLPIVVDLGKRPRKQIKKLAKGGGKLLDEVDTVMQELKVAGKINGAAVPVIIVVKQKARSNVFPWT